MKAMKKIVILFLLTFVLTFNFLPSTSYACSCAQPGTVHESLEGSNAVFSGKVVEIVDKNEKKFNKSSADLLAVRFEVEETWKGVTQTQVIVYSARDSASCGFEFALNEEYLVYAKESNGQLGVSLCSRTNSLEAANADIIELGVGTKPSEEVTLNIEGSKGEDSIFSNNYFYITLISAGLLVFLLYVYKRNKK